MNPAAKFFDVKWVNKHKYKNKRYDDSNEQNKYTCYITLSNNFDIHDSTCIITMALYEINYGVL